MGDSIDILKTKTIPPKWGFYRREELIWFVFRLLDANALHNDDFVRSACVNMTLFMNTYKLKYIKLKTAAQKRNSCDSPDFLSINEIQIFCRGRK
jgi:hypothetical protein